MSVGSVNTNSAAYVALQSLNATNAALQSTQKEISTGYRVADATDDGGAYAVAQTVRGDVSALTSVNEQLGGAQGLVTTAISSLTSISDTFTAASNGVQELLVKIADSSISDTERQQYVSQFQSVVSDIADDVDNSTYNGQTLLGQTSGTAASNFTVISNEAGATHTISAEDATTLANAVAALIGATFSRANGVDTWTPAGSSWSSTDLATALTDALSALSATGAYTTLQTSLNDQLNNAAADSNYLNAQITFNSDKIDSLNNGLGALVDADLSKESALLQSLQIKQQLGTQALSIANQAPQSLLSLFKG